MKHRVQKLVWPALLVTMLLGCQSDDADVADPNRALFEEQQETIAEFLQEQNIATQQTATGIHYRVLTENEDGIDPSPGNVAKLYYRMEQLDGTLIAELDSASGQDPVTYTFLYNSSNQFHLTVPVWLDGMVDLMRAGEEYEFFLPSALAYLDFTLPNVLPANAIVRARIFLDEVLTAAEQRLVEDHKIKDYLAAASLAGADSLASGVHYVETQAGDTSVRVAPTSEVAVNYTGTLLDGTVFDEGRLEFKANNPDYLPGFLAGVQQMSLAEKGTILIPSHAAYGQGVVALPQSFVQDLELLRENSPFNNIPPYAILRFDVEIVEVK